MLDFAEMLDAARGYMGIPLRAMQRLTRGEQAQIMAAYDESRPTRATTTPTTGEHTVPTHDTDAPPDSLLAMPGGARLHAEWSAASPVRRRQYRQAFEQLRQQAEARGQERGRADARARIFGILDCQEATGRRRLAQSLALDTTVDVDEARRLLSGAQLEDSDDATGFGAHCRRLGVTLPGNGTDYGDDDPDTIAARIVGATRRSNGSDR